MTKNAMNIVTDTVAACVHTHLNLCVLSSAIPQTTEPAMPATTIVKPIPPAFSSLP